MNVNIRSDCIGSSIFYYQFLIFDGLVVNIHGSRKKRTIVIESEEEVLNILHSSSIAFVYIFSH